MTEYEVICDQIARRKEAFIARLERHLIAIPNPKLGTPCQIWTGQAAGRNGYPRINFRALAKKGAPRSVVQFGVHRLFLTLTLKRPIAPGMDAAHLCHEQRCCSHLEEHSHQQNLRDRDERQKRQVPF